MMLDLDWGGSKPTPPDTNFQSPVWGSSSTSGRVKPPNLPDKSNTARIYGCTFLHPYIRAVSTARMYGRKKCHLDTRIYGPYIRAVLMTKSQARIQYLAVIKMANLIQILN